MKLSLITTLHMWPNVNSPEIFYCLNDIIVLVLLILLLLMQFSFIIFLG